MNTSYAQNFEDIILWRALKQIKNGFYIDIGANDPTRDSVSKLFYDRGWRGVHVEPAAEFADKLEQQRPDEKVIRAAVSTKKSKLQLVYFEGTGLSTSNLEVAEKHIDSGYVHETIRVPTITLEKILNDLDVPDIHWLKIDVEGMEGDVLKSWGESSVRPWVLLVESTRPLSSKETHGFWESEVLNRGYEFAYFDGLNRFYVRLDKEQLKSSFGPGPNYFDHFSLTESSPFVVDLQARHALMTQELIKRVGDADHEIMTTHVRLQDTIKGLEHSREEARSVLDALTAQSNGVAAAVETVVADA
ncbi:FkbM family methyltransferase, partial [Hyphomonas oceanitis]